MAMKPFCGYNFGDYWQHWLDVGSRLQRPPRIFHVNWFRKDRDGRFLWPGFGENLRVLEWIIGRCEGRAEAETTAVGLLPAPGALKTSGLQVTEAVMQELLSVDPDDWSWELDEVAEHLGEYGDRLPAELAEELQAVKEALASTGGE